MEFYTLLQCFITSLALPDKIINKLIDKSLERTNEDKNKIINVIGDYIEQSGNFGIGRNNKSDILGNNKIAGQINEVN